MEDHAGKRYRDDGGVAYRLSVSATKKIEATWRLTFARRARCPRPPAW